MSCNCSRLDCFPRFPTTSVHYRTPYIQTCTIPAHNPLISEPSIYIQPQSETRTVCVSSTIFGSLHGDPNKTVHHSHFTSQMEPFCHSGSNAQECVRTKSIRNYRLAKGINFFFLLPPQARRGERSNVLPSGCAAIFVPSSFMDVEQDLESTNVTTNNPSPSPSVILSLPDELLVAIAAMGQEGGLLFWESVNGYPNDFQSEWTLSHVSRRFRDVVIGAPTLWNVVETDLILEGSVEIFKLYLERSRPCKIRAHLRDCSRIGVEPHLIAERLSHIIPHTHRIWRLGIVATVKSMAAMLAVFRDAAVPALKRLEIEVEDKYFDCPLEIFSSSSPPALTFLKMTGFTPHFPVPQWTASLTHMELWRCQDEEDSYGHSFFAAIATQCPSLVHLYIDTTSIWNPQDMDRFTIPSLKSLHIVICFDYDAPHLLAIVHLFDTPAVTDLTIDYAHGDDICVLFDGASLPGSCFPAVRSLSFVSHGCACEEETFNHANLARIPSPRSASSRPYRLWPLSTSASPRTSSSKSWAPPHSRGCFLTPSRCVLGNAPWKICTIRCRT
ncbi:hypothetical protein FB451DRAFT_130316 [Mycena latifolia]|nr:hypothetical protein FB451DRAFT_130316 [Mycena latifolia]